MEETKIIPLANTKKGRIILQHIDKPYGEKSNPVISIGIDLSGSKDPEWKTHLPYENLEEVITNLQVALRNHNGTL